MGHNLKPTNGMMFLLIQSYSIDKSKVVDHLQVIQLLASEKESSYKMHVHSAKIRNRSPEDECLL